MAETSYPSPNHNSRNVTDGEYERIGAYCGDGVHGLPSDGDVVTAGSGLQVLVKAGTVASVRGHVWEAGPADVPLTISANAGSATRYDWIVLRLDRSTWDVTAHVVEGTPGAGNPSPSLDTGDTGAFDVCLALVSVAPGAGVPTITQATRFAGRPVSAASSGQVPFGNLPGEMQFRPDTGSLEVFNGTTWGSVYSDTGTLSLGAGFTTWEDYQASAGRRVGSVVTLRIAKRRTGSTFKASDESGSKLCTLPAALTPPSNHYFGVNVSGSDSGTVTVNVRPNGEVWAIENSKDITAGRVIAVSATYVVF
jgi:hypothetical protein